MKELEDVRQSIEDILFHWNKVDRDLRNEHLTLLGGYRRADLVEDAVRWDHANAAVNEAVRRREAISAQLTMDKTALKDRLQAFCFTVKGLLAGTEYARLVPRLPFLESSEGLFLKPIDEALRLWTRIDADTPPDGFVPPLRLRDGTDRNAFAAGIAVIRNGYRARDAAAAEERIARKRREALLPGLRARGMQYRNMVKAAYPKDHPMIRTLPKVWPQSPPKKTSSASGPEML
jgi:hypothetical protein